MPGGNKRAYVRSKSLENVAFWNWLSILSGNSKHKGVLLTQTLLKVMFSFRISLVNVNKSAVTLRYLYLKMFEYGS